MEIFINDIKYTDMKDLSVQLEFAIACAKVSGKELIGLKCVDAENCARFKNGVSKILRGMKKDGIVQLFVFDDGLLAKESTESIFMLNKFPELSDFSKGLENLVYVKL